MKSNIKLALKLIISITLFFVVSTIMVYYQASMGGAVAVEQLSDSYSSSAGIKMWQDFKEYWIVVYGLFVFGLFYTDLKKIFTSKY